MFTEKQRKLLNASHGAPSADEPEQSEAEGGMACYSCGGPVDEHGKHMSEGGSVGDDEELPGDEADEDEVPDQDIVNARGHTSQSIDPGDAEEERVRNRNFVRAVKRGR